MTHYQGEDFRDYALHNRMSIVAVRPLKPRPGEVERFAVLARKIGDQVIGIFSVKDNGICEGDTRLTEF